LLREGGRRWWAQEKPLVGSGEAVGGLRGSRWATYPHISPFLWRNIRFSAIHPHIGLFLWRNIRFSATYPHISPFLWRNIRFSAIHPHIGLFLWRNIRFSATYPHIRPVFVEEHQIFRNLSTYKPVFVEEHQIFRHHFPAPIFLRAVGAVSEEEIL